MRALSGAIITAAALIGLGLAAQGIGTRYQHYLTWKSAAGEETSSPSLKTTPDFERSRVKISEVDGPMGLCLVLLILAALIGLGITFVGLMYHHHRRHHEHLRAHPPAGAAGSSPRVTV
jgi:hypothetical protein